MPLGSVVNKFGYDNVSSDVQRKFLKEPHEEIEIIHCCKPRNIYDQSKLDKKNMPFQSIYFENKNVLIILIC